MSINPVSDVIIPVLELPRNHTRAYSECSLRSIDKKKLQYFLAFMPSIYIPRIFKPLQLRSGLGFIFDFDKIFTSCLPSSLLSFCDPPTVGVRQDHGRYGSFFLPVSRICLTHMFFDNFVPMMPC